MSALRAHSINVPGDVAVTGFPLAVARLDRHFFPGFHGSFTSRVTAS
nr:hypothetical protein [Rhodococcus opacus]